MEAREREEEEGEEEVWSWGAGTEGQLGTGKLQDEQLPQLISPLPSSSSGSISHLSCGGAHVIALTSSGRVLTWGRGTSGQLGHGDMFNSLQPKLVQRLDSFVITHVSAGWNHSGFVSDNGCLFTCGDGSFGQLGQGDYRSHCSPLEVSYFSSRHVKQIACGMRHSLALLQASCGGQVYGFGSGKHGQLGISNGNIKFLDLPQITAELDDVKIVSIHANGDHSAAISVDGHLYTWGKKFKDSSNACSSKNTIASLSCKHVALGWNHTLVLTGEGAVFMLGGSHHGRLSNNQKTILVPSDAEELSEAGMVRIPSLDGERVVDVAAGAEHSAVVTENGAIMTWGWGEHGQLGLGNAADETIPKVVNLSSQHIKELAASKVYCGSGFTFVIRTQKASISDMI